MVTNEQIETIQKVVNRCCSKYVFGYYDIEDIKQEAFIMALKVMEEYWDGIRPLENFLAVVLPNKLKNFKRKEYFRLDVSEDNKKRADRNRTKRNLMEPTELFDFDLTSHKSTLDVIADGEIIKLVYKAMPTFIKADFKRLLNDVKINKKRVTDVHNFIREFYENR